VAKGLGLLVHGRKIKIYVLLFQFNFILKKLLISFVLFYFRQE
jgi:hypothetical protein